MCLIARVATTEEITTPADDKKIRIENPIGGWRSSIGEKNEFSQEVHYPATTVNTNGIKSKSNLIDGQFSAAEGFKSPFTLIVNGLDIPLVVASSEGTISPDAGMVPFSRPFIFEPGSNSVEVRAKSAKGKVGHRVQFYEVNATMSNPLIRVVLAWDTDNTDLDLHIVTPDGEHCYYGDRILPSGGALDMDVTSGFGPEIFSTPAPKNGNYLVYVNYYGSGDASSITNAKVTVVTHAGTMQEKIETNVIPLRAPGDLTLVKTFHYP
jgi:uncharacterized protein YfaP (DUF2135 family)